jgi:acylphosphatase
MADLASIHVIVYGRVQGVFFRAFASRHAKELGLTGYVRNLPNREGVEVRAEGESNQLNELLSHLRVGPPTAEVKKLDVNWLEYSGNYSGFNIIY